MKDRISKYPRRVTLTPVEGQENTYDLARADEPIEVGTPLNKASLLSDDAASALALPQNNPTVNDALKHIGDSRATKVSPNKLICPNQVGVLSQLEPPQNGDCVLMQGATGAPYWSNRIIEPLLYVKSDSTLTSTKQIYNLTNPISDYRLIIASFTNFLTTGNDGSVYWQFGENASSGSGSFSFLLPSISSSSGGGPNSYSSNLYVLNRFCREQNMAAGGIKLYAMRGLQGLHIKGVISNISHSDDNIVESVHNNESNPWGGGTYTLPYGDKMSILATKSGLAEYEISVWGIR